MAFLLDNLVATVVVGVVALALVGLTLRRGDESRDETRFYVHQKTQAAFTTQIETDLTDAGLFTPDDEEVIRAATPTRLAFYGRIDRDGNGGVIEYRRESAGVMDGVPVYRIERWVDGALTGASGSTVSRFEVSLLDETGGAAGSPGDARAVSVEVEWVLPFEEADGAAARQAMRRSAWSTYIRPVGLTS